MSNNKKEDIADNLKYFFQKITGTVEHTEKFKEQERVDNRMMAMLSYVLPFIPFIAERNSSYVKFHSNQGMNLLVWYVLLFSFLWIVDEAFPWEYITDFFSVLLWVSLVAIMAFGIINTLKDRARELPLVSKINFIDILGQFFGK